MKQSKRNRILALLEQIATIVREDETKNATRKRGVQKTPEYMANLRRIKVEKQKKAKIEKMEAELAALKNGGD